MSKRLHSFRTGDRAEDLGVYLLKAFCAMAPIPRQEDFGLADAVATLLRPEGKFWYAEDSFLIQFKSRTKRQMKLLGPVFSRWLAQDLSVFVGRVNPNTAMIELFTLGSALFDRRVHDVKGLVAWLVGRKEGVNKQELHLQLKKPILKWSVTDTEDPEFTERTYAILKEWLCYERWNRRYFRAGVAREVLWETNEMPKIGKTVHTWAPERGSEALTDIEPLVHLLGLHAQRHPELWSRMHALEESIRGPDDTTIHPKMREMFEFCDVQSRMADILDDHPDADLVITVQYLRLEETGAEFWIHTRGTNNAGNSTRHIGSWEDLEQEGFEHTIDRDVHPPTVKISFDRYFATQPVPHEVIDAPEETPNVGIGDHSPCFFLRRAATDSADEPDDDEE